jgi:maleylpyruvate isomerase
MTTPTARLTSLRSSTSALLRGFSVEHWSDADVRAPSLCPGWTRGHVLTHLARGADGIAATLAGALRGEVVPRYPNGRAGRNSDIEAGAGRPIAEILADVTASAERLDRVLGAVADADGWQLPCDDRSAEQYLAARWREIEIHRVDAMGAYTADEWPAAFVADLLPDVIGDLGGRTDAALQITVDKDESVTTELAGTTWTCGDGAHPTIVTGPDWALLAWVLGRPAATKGTLNRTPDLSAWR